MLNQCVWLQVQQESMQAWQQFCEASLVVHPVVLADTPAFLQAQAIQSSHGGLYQHRLPQLGNRMQQLLVEAGTACLASTEGTTPISQCLISSLCNRQTIHGGDLCRETINYRHTLQAHHECMSRSLLRPVRGHVKALELCNSPLGVTESLCIRWLRLHKLWQHITAA